MNDIPNECKTNKLKITLYHMASLKLPPVINNNSILFKADSGASKHYFRIKDAHALTNMTNVTAIRKVVLPNNDTIAVTKQGILPINPDISSAGGKASVLPGLKTLLYCH